MGNQSALPSILRICAEKPEPELIQKAAQVLLSGQLVILPTDTVYGIGILAVDETNPHKLFSAKKRPNDKSIPLLVSSPADVAHLGKDIPDYAYALAQQHWPGALTLVVQASDKIPPQFVAEDGSVALRMPAHSIALDILAAVAAPIACSSANLSGMPPVSSIDELDAELAKEVSLLIDGGHLQGGFASTVVSCLSSEPYVLRPGPITI